MRSASSRGASNWLTAPPGVSGANLSNEHCKLALRQRLHAPLFDDLPITCDCGADIDADEEQGHVHWCQQLKVPASFITKFSTRWLTLRSKLASAPAWS